MLELVAVLAQTLACVSKSSCCLKASVLLVAMSAADMVKQLAEVQKQIDGNGPILNRLEIACNLLREMNLLQELDVLPEKVLCHPCNRGGLGLNPHNAHRTGAKVQSIGADLKQLDTYLFTMPPAGAVAAKHIKFNEELVSIAEGMLAPVNGHELYTSVAGGHFEAFCKAANAGCKTNQKNIMDEQGNIDVGKLKKDFVFKKLLEKGWRCMVIDGHAEELIPGLPDFIQRAKNAHNSIASEASETEVCVCQSMSLLQICRSLVILSIGTPALMQPQLAILLALATQKSLPNIAACTQVVLVLLSLSGLISLPRDKLLMLNLVKSSGLQW